MKSASQPSAYLSRLSTVDSIRAELDELEGSLPWTIRRLPGGSQGGSLPTGVRELLSRPLLRHIGSFQLTLLGINVILHRIELDILDRTCSPHIVSTVLQAAFNAAAEVVALVTELSIDDRAMFWMPCELRYQLGP